MSAITKSAASSEKKFSKKEAIVEFVPSDLAASFLLRCGALIVDYILIISVPVIGLLLRGITGANSGNETGFLGSVSTLLAVLIAVTNFFIFPALTGQSVGKMLTGIRILKMDGRQASLGSIVFRNTVGYLLTVSTLGIGFLLSAVNKNGRALHDYFAGTVVVYARRRTGKKSH